MASSAYLGFGTDVVDQVTVLCEGISKDYPNAIFFTSKLIFEQDNWFTRLLHNQAALAIQRRLHFDGLQMVIVPMKVQQGLNILTTSVPMCCAPAYIARKNRSLGAPGRARLTLRIHKSFRERGLANCPMRAPTPRLPHYQHQTSPAMPDKFSPLHGLFPPKKDNTLRFPDRKLNFYQKSVQF